MDQYISLLGITEEQSLLAGYVAMSPDKLADLDETAFLPHQEQAHKLNKIATGE